jgi:hypothetical protein
LAQMVQIMILLKNFPFLLAHLVQIDLCHVCQLYHPLAVHEVAHACVALRLGIEVEVMTSAKASPGRGVAGVVGAQGEPFVHTGRSCC